MSEPTRMQRLSPKSEYRGLVGIVNVSYRIDETETNKLVDKMSDYM